jgi:hypothetical protein
MVRMTDLSWHRGRRRQLLIRLREKYCGTATAADAVTSKRSQLIRKYGDTHVQYLDVPARD